MIELRWVIRADQHYRDGLPQGHGPLYKVLQYRYQETEIDGYRQWSDWIDVPTVTDSTA